ncbi:hypothetical protein C8R44DRAFT_726033 [Mycena epipterygia]|nr:hypothetical protein C8R44DRAFT_726033 [Mycena epipterygia]
MPLQTIVTQTRLDNMIAGLTPIISLLNEFSDAFGSPFIPAISNTTLSLITLVQFQSYLVCQNVKKNKEQCIQLMENIHQVLYTVINLLIKSGTGLSLSPAILHNFGKLTETLHQVYAFMEAQHDGNKIKHFFCQRLQQAVDVLKMEGSISLHGRVIEMQKETERIHKELLESISTSSDATISDSSNSISMLPAKLKILHGWESEMKLIVETLHQESARIAILGAGGMGKTSLAKAALHHPDIVSKYQHWFFMASDSATTSIELAVLIGLHLGLKPGNDLTKPAVYYFSNQGPSLLVLDNLETLWEPLETCGGVEEFLLSLTDVSHLALMANNMPLAVDLITHLVDHEGCEDVLARWHWLNISSFALKILQFFATKSSPKLWCQGLLSLLSILPDGLSDAELLQSKLPIKNILDCRSMLLGTSLAYEDNKKRLKSLVPIREHMKQFHPAPPSLIHQVKKHFHLLLDVYENHFGADGRTSQPNNFKYGKPTSSTPARITTR